MKKNSNKNKRAFTLTELLIVVIVIGVLSAVTLPKFTRVIENRKVTEAEEMMSAVRTEQERRCAMDKNYTLKFDNLSDVISSSKTKNYNYSLEKEGISAKSNKGHYTLKMLSYQDGSFCCSGADCGKLNKNYPSCDGLTFPSSGCSGTDGTVEVTPSLPELEPTPLECREGQVKGSQACNGCGTQTTQKCVGGKWVSQLGACSKTAAECVKPECTDGQVRGSQTCNGCGTQTTQKCVSGKWVSQLGQCSKTAAECPQECDEDDKPIDETVECECGSVEVSYICSAATNYKWVLGEQPPCPEKPKTFTCPDGKTTYEAEASCDKFGDWQPNFITRNQECPKKKTWSCTKVQNATGDLKVLQTCTFSHVQNESSMTGQSCSDVGMKCKAAGDPNAYGGQASYICTCIESLVTNITTGNGGGGNSGFERPEVPSLPWQGAEPPTKWDKTWQDGPASDRL